MDVPSESDFDLNDFLPYLLNQAAEAASHGFQEIYRSRYGMTRTQWRVMANLGKFGAMTARDVCAVSHIEKTKVSRAVASLEREGLLARNPSERDRRAEMLSLTGNGLAVYADLGSQAIKFDRNLRKALGDKMSGDLDLALRAIMAGRSGAAVDHRD